MKQSPCKALLLGFIGSSAAGLPSLEALYPSAVLEVAEHVSFSGVFIRGPFERFVENNRDPDKSSYPHFTENSIFQMRYWCKLLFKKKMRYSNFIYFTISKVLHVQIIKSFLFCFVLLFFYAFFSTDFEDLFDDDDIQ